MRKIDIKLLVKKIISKIDRKIRYLPIIGIVYYPIKDGLKFINKKYISKTLDIPEFVDFQLIVGRRGAGKTLALTYLLNKYRKKYGNRILIATNYKFKNQDFQIQSWRDFTKKYDLPIIFGIDEIQNEFESTKWKTFPMPVFNEFTLSRKNRKMMISTAQELGRVDIRIRQYSNTILYIRSIFKRFYYIQYHDRLDFELSQVSGKTNKRSFSKPKFTEWFIAHDEIRNLYDTNEIIERIQSADYENSRDFDNIDVLERLTFTLANTRDISPT